MRTGTTSDPELLVELDRSVRRPLRRPAGGRPARRGPLGTAGRGARGLPASRALAGDLGVSRRMVVDAYAQLLAEGYLIARAGAGTFVAGAAAATPAVAVEPPAARTRRSTSSRAYPDLASFPPARLAARAAGDAAGGARPGLRLPRPARRPRAAQGAGRPSAPRAGRRRRPATRSWSARAPPRASRCWPGRWRRSRIAVEDPGLPVHREILSANGALLAPLAVDEDGARVEDLARRDGRRGSRSEAVLRDARPPVADGRGALAPPAGPPCWRGRCRATA